MQRGSFGHGPGQFGQYNLKVIADPNDDLYVSDRDPLFPNMQKFSTVCPPIVPTARWWGYLALVLASIGVAAVFIRPRRRARAPATADGC